MSKPKNPKTYFEQVPLEIVKKIAEVEPPDDKENASDETVKSSEKK